MYSAKNSYFTYANGINSLGFACGKVGTVTVEAYRRLHGASTSESLSPLDGHSFSAGNGINLFGTTVGASYNPDLDRQATVWTNPFPSPRALDLLNPDQLLSEAFSVNRESWVVGQSHTLVQGMSVPHAVLWRSIQKPQDLGTLAGDDSSVALAINDPINGSGSEVVVGYSWVSGTSAERAFVWDDNNGIMDLTARTSGLPNGLVVSRATGINSLGEISAWVEDPIHHAKAAFVLEPDLNGTARIGRVRAPFAGSTTSLHGIGFDPGSTVLLIWDTATGQFSSPCGPNPALAVNPNAHPPLGTVTANPVGRIDFVFPVPSTSFQGSVFLQAYATNGPSCKVSNLITEIVQ